MLNEQREPKDLWKQAFPVGTERDQFSEYNWNFSNLEDAFAESGLLHGEEKVFLFGCIEPQLLSFGGRWRTTYIPVVVAIVSPFPPSDKIAILSLQDESEEIINMEDMNMGWAPYIPPGDRASSVPEIFILSRAHGEAAFELDPSSQCCLQYFYNPFMADEIQQNTVVGVLYPTEAGPVVCEFNWDIDELEEFTDELIAAGELSRITGMPSRSLSDKRFKKHREIITRQHKSRFKLRRNCRLKGKLLHLRT